ncbi:ATP-binding protein [Actinomadura fibrosa]|uniref:ATP-binding protein n=1 Tax=Actinomadura fibrosa TaxID=111802 RepID=A0ABW2XM50_9ACTN|nr:ATP-binding protein [Actinomadura fibrosa]
MNVNTEAIDTLIALPVPEAARAARELVGRAFGRWGLDSYVARTVVTEFVSNACRHAGTEEAIIVRVFLRDGGVPVVEVWDRGNGLPELHVPDLVSECGRGLFAVDRLARRWGTRPLLEGGKVVWAEVAAEAVC